MKILCTQKLKVAKRKRDPVAMHIDNDVELIIYQPPNMILQARKLTKTKNN